MNDASSERFRQNTRARLQAQFLDEPDFTAPRSLVNVLESVVEAAESRDYFSPVATFSKSEDPATIRAVEEEIKQLEAQLLQYQRRVVLLQSQTGAMPPPPVPGESMCGGNGRPPKVMASQFLSSSIGRRCCFFWLDFVSCHACRYPLVG